MLDTYGENDPYTALYTVELCWRALTGIGTLSLSLNDLLWTYIPRKDLVDLPLGTAVGRTLDAMRSHVDANIVADTGCAKLIPAVARWVQREVDAVGDRDVLDANWNTRVGRIGRLPIMPSPVFLERAASLFVRFRYLCDWFLGARPDLGQYATWQEADAAAALWHESLVVRDTMAAPESTVVYEWPDGWTVAELDNWDSFRFEGGALGHCIGDRAMGYWEEYIQGRSRFFSIRDSRNRPWFTIQVNAPYTGYAGHFGRGNAKVHQIKGCKNRLPGMRAPSRDCLDPDPTECTRVFDFLASAGDAWELERDYWTCWAFAAAAVGLPEVVQRRDAYGFPAGALLRPPAPIDPGKPTKALEPEWWTKQR